MMNLGEVVKIQRKSKESLKLLMKTIRTLILQKKLLIRQMLLCTHNRILAHLLINSVNSLSHYKEKQVKMKMRKMIGWTTAKTNTQGSWINNGDTLPMTRTLLLNARTARNTVIDRMIVQMKQRGLHAFSVAKIPMIPSLVIQRSASSATKWVILPLTVLKRTW